MNAKYCIPFLLLFLTTLSASAQNSHATVSGIVTDASTGEPLPGAIVSSGRTAVTTNTSGHYSLHLSSGPHTIRCAFMGFEDQEHDVELTEDLTLDFSMEVAAEAIASVVVLSDGEKPMGASFGKIDINIDQLQFMPLFLGEQDVFKYFQLLPGVTGGKEGSSDLNIRGGSADQTMILLDDVPLYNHNHAFGLISVFNGEMLGGAELYKGNVPATYGGRLSGVAALTSRNGNTERHSQMLGVGTMTLSFAAEGPVKDKGSYIVSARYFTPHLFLTAYNQIAQPTFRTNYGFFDVTGKLNFRLNERNELTWNLYAGYDGFDHRYDDAGIQHSGSEEIPYDRTSRNQFGWGSLSSSLRLNTRLGDGLYLTNLLYFSGMNNWMTATYRDATNASSSLSDIRSAVGDWGYKSVLWYATRRSEYAFGLQANCQPFIPKDIRSEVTDSEGHTYRNSQVYGTMLLGSTTLFADGNTSINKWNFHYGLRIPLYFRQGSFAWNIEPRVGIAFDINDKHALFASYDRMSQPLFTLSRQFGGMPMDLWMAFRDDKIQTADQIALGWKFRPGSAWFISVEAFYKHMNDLYIVQDEDAMLNGHGGFGMGTGQAFGGELIVQYTGRKNMFLASYSHIYSKRMYNGTRFDFEYDIPYNLNVYYQHEILRRGNVRHTLSANLNFHAGIPYMMSKEIYPPANNGLPEIPPQIPNNPQYANVRLPDYFRLDLNYSMEKKLRNGRRIWQISILNVTNHFNPYMVYIRNGKYMGTSILPIMPSFSYKRYW